MVRQPDDHASAAAAPGVLQFGEFTLDPRRFELHRGPDLLHLQPKTFDLLHHLLRHADRVVEKDELLAAVWPGVVVTEHSLTRCIKDLRKALDDDAGAPRYIETVARRGYRMLVQPQAQAAAAAPAQAAAATGLAADAGTAAALDSTLSAAAGASVRTGITQRRTWPWALAVLALVAALLVAFFGRSPPLPTASIAVLPFDNLGIGDDAQAFADGLAEDLLERFAQLPRMQVVARTSSFAFRGEKEDIKRIAQALGVVWVLEGSVRRDASRLLVNVQLVDARSGYRAWTGRYERALADLFELQDEIARSVAAQVMQKIDPDTSLPDAHRSASVDAWQDFMLARELFHRRTQDWRAKALAALERAVAREPDFARAQALLGIVLALSEGRVDNDRPPGAAQAAVQHALQTDPRLGLAHAAQGLLLINAGDAVGADTALQRALELDPLFTTAHNWRAIALLSLGRTAQADAQIDAGLRLDPLNPVLLENRGVAFEREGLLDDAQRAFERMLQLPARPVGAYYRLTQLALDRGQLVEALRWTVAIARDGAARWGTLAEVPMLPVLVRLGLDQEAERRLAALPYDKLPPAVFRALSDALLRLGRHGQADSLAQTLVARGARMPTWWPAHRVQALFLQGRVSEGMAALQAMAPGVSIHSNRELADLALAQAWARRGESDPATSAATREALQRVVDQGEAGMLGRNNPEAMALHALALALSGRDDDALAKLQAARAAGWNDHRWVRNDPRWGLVREQARFRSLLDAAAADATVQRGQALRRAASGDAELAAVLSVSSGKP